MKHAFIIFFFHLITAETFAGDKDRFDFKNCQAPSEPFFMEKIKDSYKFSSGESRLKDIVLDQKNYQFREEIKELKSQLGQSRGEAKEQVSRDIANRFDQMVWNLETNETINQFPTKESTSTIKGTSESSLMISMDNLSQEQIDFLPPAILKKLGKAAKIHYTYPEKTFSYFVSYDGQELPLQNVAGRIQKDFEGACQARVVENAYIKSMNGYQITGPKGGSSPSIGNSPGGASSQ